MNIQSNANEFSPRLVVLMTALGLKKLTLKQATVLQYVLDIMLDPYLLPSERDSEWNNLMAISQDDYYTDAKFEGVPLDPHAAAMLSSLTGVGSSTSTELNKKINWVARRNT